MKRPIVAIDPLGTEVVLPAVVIGFEVTDHAGIESELRGDAPDWLFLIDQQAGGYQMTNRTFLGLVLRLEANFQPADVRGRSKIAGLRAMAEAPDFQRIEREYPALVGIVGTSGEHYSARALSQLYDYLWGPFGIPTFKSGIEACVRFDCEDAVDSFRGWRLMHCALPKSGVSKLYNSEDCTFLALGNISEVSLTDSDNLSEDHIALMKELIPESFSSNAPCAFLLWENCD